MGFVGLAGIFGLLGILGVFGIFGVFGAVFRNALLPLRRTADRPGAG
jgi:hypothetical protein